jgi:hypothetical protein
MSDNSGALTLSRVVEEDHRGFELAAGGRRRADVLVRVRGTAVARVAGGVAVDL